MKEPELLQGKPTQTWKPISDKWVQSSIKKKFEDSQVAFELFEAGINEEEDIKIKEWENQVTLKAVLLIPPV